MLWQVFVLYWLAYEKNTMNVLKHKIARGIKFRVNLYKPTFYAIFDFLFLIE